jgi:two-component system sensor histidine kinase RegB
VKINEQWLVRLRWVAVVGQLATIAVAGLLFDVKLAVAPLLAIIGWTAITNLLFAAWLKTQRLATIVRNRDHVVLATVMTLDLLALTALLYFSGGPANPFTIFYFLNLALAAVLLSSKWGWMLTLLAVACLAALFNWHTPMPELSRTVNAQGLTLAELGFIVAFVGCAGAISYFITRVTRELQRREYELRLAEQQRARSDRLEALATLAAGAGHELASPLSTIAVIANDLSRHLQGTDVPTSVIEDVRLIRGELDHCRKILDGLASSAGQASGEEMKPITIRTLIDETIEGLRRRERVELQINDRVADQSLMVPRVGIAQALRGLVRNALDATPDPETIVLRINQRSPHWCQVTVIDSGHGMTADILARAGEPFFTTKEPGQGMGLGIFLARNVVERLGGRFELESTPGRGSNVTIQLPMAESSP